RQHGDGGAFEKSHAEGGGRRSTCGVARSTVSAGARRAKSLSSESARGVNKASANRMSEVYVSTDVETDGPIPGPHSMLSFASAAYRADKTMVSTFPANLKTLQGAAPSPVTMDWWQQHPDAWAATRT